MGITVSAGNSPWIVSSGLTDSGDIVVSGGTEIVSSGGTTSNATIQSGGQIIVSSGGTI